MISFYKRLNVNVMTDGEVPLRSKRSPMWLQVSDRGQAVCKSLLAIPPGAWDTLMEAHMYLARVPGTYHLREGEGTLNLKGRQSLPGHPG